MYKGFDVSICQGTITLQHYQQMAADGCSFIISRCGVGNDGSDGNYIHNITLAQQAGLKVACYHFIYPLNDDGVHKGRDPISQAQAHYRAAQGQRCLVDVEWPTPETWLKWGLSAQSITNWLRTYLQEYERLSGSKPAIYIYPYFAQMINLPQEFAQYPLWIASYESTPRIPRPWTNYTIWQTTGGKGKLPNGAPVDTNVAPDLSFWDSPISTNIPATPIQTNTQTSPFSIIPEVYTPPVYQPAQVIIPTTNVSAKQLADSGTNNTVSQSNSQVMITPATSSSSSIMSKIGDLFKFILPKIFHI
jgi:GH25 family lysozyme M1 (1,4-beta-N-acetylmuramidase)